MPNNEATIVFEESIKLVKNDVGKLEKRIEKNENKLYQTGLDLADIKGKVNANEERSKDNKETIKCVNSKIDDLEKASVKLTAISENIVKNIESIDTGMNNLTTVVNDSVTNYHELDKRVVGTSVKVGIIIAVLVFIATNIVAIVNWIK